MQENRSFDSYFGTYPGADGFPRKDGKIDVCAIDSRSPTGCDPPYHDASLVNIGGPHNEGAAAVDMAGGRMDGFVEEDLNAPSKGCQNLHDPNCRSGSLGTVDVMGYHDAREIPNYWAYASQFVLQDHLFEPNFGWSLPSHLFTVSAWSAKCDHQRATHCHSDLQDPDAQPDKNHPGIPHYAWTDLTYLLFTHHVSSAYYLDP